MAQPYELTSNNSDLFNYIPNFMNETEQLEIFNYLENAYQKDPRIGNADLTLELTSKINFIPNRDKMALLNVFCVLAVQLRVHHFGGIQINLLVLLHFYMRIGLLLIVVIRPLHNA